MSIQNTSENTRIKIVDLTPKTSLLETDLLIVQDFENTKKVTLRDLLLSIIKDNEAPATHRLYSSDKIDTLIVKLDNTFTELTDELDRNVEKLQDESATKTELNAAVTTINEDISGKVGNIAFSNTMKDYRQITTKITANDLDISADERKIRVENLSQEVLNAMTGNTPVTVPKTPVGGWGTESIADNAITSDKLGYQYSFRGYIDSGDVDNIIDTGMYLLSDKVTNLPEDLPEGDRLLTVLAGNKNVIQIVEEALDSDFNTIYRRRSTVESLRFAKFKAIYENRDDTKIPREQLSEDYGNGGVLSNISIFNIVDDGHYQSDGTVTELPVLNVPCSIRVDNFGTEIIYTVTYISENECDIYEAKLSYNTMMLPSVTPWYKTNSFLSSIFSGKSIALFGDGILYGRGADDYPTESIPSLLRDLYTFKVFNYCIDEATAGSYNDPNLQARCVLTQLANTDISLIDYAMVMVGSEDWVNGELIGNDNNETDTTYKGSLNLIVEGMYRQNPDVKIIFCTPIFRSRIRLGDNRNSDEYTVNDLYLNSFIDAMKDIAYKYHIPIIDMNSISGICKLNFKNYLNEDGLHLSSYGQSVIASKMVHYMESVF